MKLFLVLCIIVVGSAHADEPVKAPTQTPAEAKAQLHVIPPVG